MLKQRKVIDIFPPKKLKEYYDFPAEKDIKRDKTIVKPKRKKGNRFWCGFFFVSLFLIAGVLFLHFVLAKVSIEIWPETENLILDEKLTVDINNKQADLASKVIPGEFFETEKSAIQQFNSTGQATKESNAQGTIRVYNNYNLSQTLVQNTRFQPALDKVIYFRSVKKVVIPAKSYLDIEVKADRPGEDYNIEPATFSVPGLAGLPQYYSVYAKSFSQMTGGFKGTVSQVSNGDLESAEKSLLEKIKGEAKNYFISQSKEGLIFLDEGMVQEIIESSSSVPAGATADSFKFNLKIKTKTIAFKKSDLDNFVGDLIASRLLDINSKAVGTDKKIEKTSLKVDYSADKIDLQSGKIILNLKISVKIYSDVDQGSIKKALYGKSIKEGQALLKSQPTIVRTELNVFPLWLKRIPENEEKIRIKLNIDPS